MPHDIHDDTKAQKNLLHGSGKWVWLFEVQIRNGQNVLFLTNNASAVTFNGNTYLPGSISLQEMEENQQGDLPSLVLTVDNSDRAVEAFLQHYDGLRGEKVVITIANSEDMDDTSKTISRTFRVRSVASDHQAAVFQLSTHPFLGLKWPPFLYLRDHCRFRYKDQETCKYDGTLPTCGRTLADCVAHNNAVNFGGFPFIPRRRGAIQ